jgi:hypothetical protein
MSKKIISNKEKLQIELKGILNDIALNASSIISFKRINLDEKNEKLDTVLQKHLNKLYADRLRKFSELEKFLLNWDGL